MPRQLVVQTNGHAIAESNAVPASTRKHGSTVLRGCFEAPCLLVRAARADQDAEEQEPDVCCDQDARASGCARVRLQTGERRSEGSRSAQRIAARYKSTRHTHSTRHAPPVSCRWRQHSFARPRVLTRLPGRV
eukprot:6174023-Pleurochrysis_carterae.AAC.12